MGINSIDLKVLIFIEKKFAEMVKTMTGASRWTLRMYKNSVDEQLSSWMMNIPGMGNSDGVKDSKAIKGPKTRAHLLLANSLKSNINLQKYWISCHLLSLTILKCPTRQPERLSHRRRGSLWRK